MMSKKFNFTLKDGFIIVMVVLCIMGILFRENVADGISKTVYNETAEIHFIVNEANRDLISSINAGDIFYFENGAEFGTLLEGYSYKNSEIFINDQSGNHQQAEYSEKYDLNGRFISNGRSTDNGFLCGTEKIFINSEIELHSQNAVCTIKVTKIENVSNGNSVQ